MNILETIRTDRRYRWKRCGYYYRVACRAIAKGVPLRDYLALAAPLRWRPDTRMPHALYLEFSNVCDVTCVYCGCPRYAYDEPFMLVPVLDGIVRSLAHEPVNKINLSGGEPTLHPQFGAFVEALRGRARFMNIITNGQWRDEAAPAVLASGAFDMVEFSVDAGDRAEYERARVGADYDRLVGNLARLRAEARRRAPRTMIGIRLLIRPSMRKREREYLRRWAPFCDTIMPQYISKPNGLELDEDVYVSTHERENTWPRCSHPSRAMQIKADGNVPLCCINGHAVSSAAIVLGNVCESSIAALWRDPRLVQYRRAHRMRDVDRMPACRGCVGA